jgi:asparagine synthetase B (glutamine-hydrolysing)
MCGIFFSLSRNAYVAPDLETERLLRNRGPDSIGTHQVRIPCNTGREKDDGLHATFVSTVLALRGTSVVEQPLRDDASGSVLCWNGEAWAIAGNDITGNDSQHVFASLLASSSSHVASERRASVERVASAVSAIRGPYALVYYDARNGYLYYARDCLGRRSLLRASTSTDSLILSSVCNSSGGEWAEAEADGLYVIDLATAANDLPLHVVHIPWRLSSEQPHSDSCLVGECPADGQLLIYLDVTFPRHQQDCAQGALLSHVWSCG